MPARLIAPLFACLLLLSGAATAAPEDACNFSISEQQRLCLAPIYDKLRQQLEARNQRILKATQDAPDATPMARDRKQATLKALQAAHDAWTRLVETECYQLVEAQMWDGNGGPLVGTRCMIERTRSRIVFLEKNWLYAEYAPAGAARQGRK